MSNSQTTQKFSPGVLSLLPIFYVGWSDSVLSPSEIKLIHQKIKNLDFLTKDDKAYLIKWTNPAKPPSAKIFRDWVQAIKEHAANLPAEKKQSLSELGLEIAKESIGYKAEEIWNAPDTKAAIEKMEHAIGVDNPSSRRMLLGVSHLETKDQKALANDLQDVLDGKTKDIKNRMRALLRDPFFCYQTIRNKEEYRQRTLDQLKVLAQQGLSAYAFPKEYGGEARYGEHIAIFEMLAFHDLSLTIKFGVQFGLFGGAVLGLGTEKHHRLYIQPLIKADLLGCFAMTETGHGSNVQGLETTATYDKETDSLIINTPTDKGNKEYIGNAMHSSMAAVFCQLIVDGQQQGVHCVLVPIRNEQHECMPGVTVKDNGYKMGLNGVDNGKLWFDHVSVPRENLLDRFGTINEEGEYVSEIANPNKRFFMMLGALVTGRVSVGLAGISASKSALTIAIKYGLKRRQFAPKDGMPETILMDYPSHQDRLLPRLAKTYAYHFGLQKLANDFTNTDQGTEDFREIEARAAGLKAMATWHTTDTIQECREACGGKGYLSENRLSDLKADTDIFTTFEGDNTVLLQLLAKSILSNFKNTFNDQGFRTIVRYLYEKASVKSAENRPFYARNASVEHLSSNEFFKDAFDYRVQQMTFSVASRMQKFIKQRLGSHEAYLKCQLHLLDLAKASVEQEILIAFIEAVEETQNPELKALLTEVLQLFALTTIEENKGFFLENDYMTGTKTKAVRRLKAKTCQALKEKAEILVDAFGIPEELLGAQIVLYN